MATQLKPAELATHLINEKGGSIDKAIDELTKALDSQRWISSDMIDVLEETREIMYEMVHKMMSSN
mgnify:CR=1 FL=1